MCSERGRWLHTFCKQCGLLLPLLQNRPLPSQRMSRVGDLDSELETNATRIVLLSVYTRVHTYVSMLCETVGMEREAH